METPEMQGQPAKPAPASFPKPVLSDEGWEEVRRAVEAGLAMPEASERFGIDYQTLKVRAWREKWLHDSRIKTLAEQVKAKEAAKVANLKPVETGEARPVLRASEALVESYEGKRSGTLLGLAKAAEKGISRLVEADLPIENWQDAKIVADIAMKLHNVGQEGVQVNVLVGGDGGFDGPVVETEADCVDDEIDE